MKKQAVILGGIVIVAISSFSGTSALSLISEQQWSNYIQTWKEPHVIGKDQSSAIAKDDSITVCITKNEN